MKLHVPVDSSAVLSRQVVSVTTAAVVLAAAAGWFGGAAAMATATAHAQAAAVRQFEEASIRSCDPDNVPPAPAGMRGGGANSFQMTPGRTHALCMTLATVIRHAYGYGPAQLETLN